MYISNFQPDGTHILSMSKHILGISKLILGINSTRALIPGLY